MQPQQNLCNLYLYLCFETVFLALKITQNCYLHYNLNFFFLKIDDLFIYWPLCYVTCHTGRLSSPLDKIWRQWDFKNLYFKTGKNWKCSLGYSKIPIFYLFMNLEKLGSIHSRRSTFQKLNFESMDKLGNVMS